MKQLPDGVAPYRKTPSFDETTVPKSLLNDHSTKTGVWGVIHVTAGSLRYSIPSRGEEIILTPDRNGIVEPEMPHHVSPVGMVNFYVEFWR